MRGIYLLLVLVCSARWLAAQQSPSPATVRMEVTSASGPVVEAMVTINQLSTVTDEHGVATVMVDPGKLDVRVSKDGFLPATVSITVESGQE